MNKAKWFPLLRLIAGALIIELTVCNFSSWRSLFYWDRITYENVRVEGGEKNSGGYTAPDGTLKLCLDGIDRTVNDLYIACDFPDDTPVAYTVSLTDEGNHYPYELPGQVLLPSFPRSRYTNLYPAGRVRSVTVRLTVPEESTVTVHGIGINARIPFLFSPLRLLVILGIISLLYYPAHADLQKCQSCTGSTRQRLITALAAALLIAAAWMLSHLNPLCVNPPWPHHKQYQQLAEVMAKGQFYLDAEPSDGLLQAENPYDTVYLQANGIDYLADYDYYDGNYYVYFGVVPELMLYLPVYLLTGHHVPNHIAVFLFYCGFIAAVFALVRELVRKWFPRTPYYLYLMICILTVCCGNYLFVIARPDLYDVPIMAANMFTAVSLTLWIRGTDTAPGKRRKVFLFLGSLCMALVAGCRPQMLLFSLLAFPLFWSCFVPRREPSGLRKDMPLSLRSTWNRQKTLDALSICLPYAITAVFIMYYNAARFGSPFDFGASYSLTSNDMTRRSFHLHQALLGIWHYLIRPPVVTSDFPFLQGVQITSSSYMGKLNAEYTYGGILACNAFLWVLFWVHQVKERLQRKGIFALAALSSAVSLALVLIDVTYAGILQRYMVDMVWGFWFSAILFLLARIERASEHNRTAYGSVIPGLICILQLFYGFGILFGNGDLGLNLQAANPGLYYFVRELFRF